ncbi:flagellar protein FlbT [Rhodovulum bhavnagarense]|uniref:Flagellar protein FlbT n=1 Tax=Rhodovulum bhavnagarense TaxID=992286 RepID=A0A4R2RGI6_9RHOB|nr:flagellar biosynthesis repressor FlbT [Rhodovulum bhavnagarense]TCP61197.1 flagellar protein FlbT [Rhodovulum bhavnagarense]
MSGLILKLGPRERLLINGAVVENGERRTRLSIQTPNASILRLRDAIHPEDAVTPVRRLCYMAQLILSGDSAADDMRPRLLRGIEQLSQVLVDPDSRAQIGLATQSLMSGQYYDTLRSLRRLLPREERLPATARSQ